MIYCPKCGKANDEDSFYCSRCGFPLDEDPQNYNQTDNSNSEQKRSHTKTKSKSHTKTKVKYKDKDNGKEKGKMSFFQSFMMFFFILLSICALGAAAYLGYYIYQNQNIVVPNVTGYSYNAAQSTLKDLKLQAEKVEQTVTDKDEVGVVIKQSKKAGSKAMENTVIKLTVGVLDTKVTVPYVTGSSLTEALNALNKNNVKYKIVYETSDKDNNIVLDQSVKAGKKIENTETVTIIVSKNEEVDTPQTTTPDSSSNVTDESNNQNSSVDPGVS